MRNLFLYMLGVLFVLGCSSPKKDESTAISSAEATSVSNGSAAYETSLDGEKIDFFTLKGTEGFEIGISNYGARIISILMPDKNGKIEDIVLGFPDIQQYLDVFEDKEPYFGCTVGRFAGRIGNFASFKIDGEKYNLHINDNANILHGGIEGLHHKVWKVVSSDNQSISMNYLSPDGEEGFPGNLNVTVTYSLSAENVLKIEYRAKTDKSTHVNLANQTYFNLQGENSGSIENHQLKINAEHFLPVNSELIPTGEFSAVAGTSFDFTSFKSIGESINVQNDQIDYGKGFDHTWVVKNKDNPELVLQAIVKEPVSGRTLEISSVEPGIQFYSGNSLDGTLKGKSGDFYQKRFGFCLVPQHFPNTPNEKKFPSTRLDPKGEFYSYSTYKFSVEE